MQYQATVLKSTLFETVVLRLKRMQICMYKSIGVIQMFQVRQTEEMLNKTFRLPASLLDELAKIAEHEKVSVNNLVRQCCEYALSNMKTEK